MPRTPADDVAPRPGRRGHGRATLQDVAQAAGVTAITVSRHLRSPGAVAPATAERIRQALASTGYVPNKQAGLLASGAGRMVAALLPNLANSIFAETAQGLSDTLQAAGFELLLAASGYSLEREEQQLRALLGWRPAAVVLTGRRHTAGTLALMRQAQAGGTPVIEIWDHPGASRPEPPAGTNTAGDTAPAASAGLRAPAAFPQVGFSHEAVGAAMAEHLLRAGHRRLAYVDSGVAEDYRAHERGQAFAATARAAGAAVDVLAAAPGDAFDAGRSVLAALLDAGPPPITAAAFANDHLACGALLQAQRLGLTVPGRIALLGFGDFPLARQLSPALSSVRLPRQAIGIEAARLLLRTLEAGAPAPHLALPWALVARGSTSPER